MITDTQRTLIDDYLLTWGEAFLIDRKANGLSDASIRFYTQKLKMFFDYCEAQQIKHLGQLTPLGNP